MNIFDRKIFRYLILRIVKAALMQLFSVYELKRRREREREVGRIWNDSKMLSFVFLPLMDEKTQSNLITGFVSIILPRLNSC